MGRRAALSLALLGLLVLAPGRARGAEWAVMGSSRLFVERLPADLLFTELRFPGTQADSGARTAYQAHAAAHADLRPMDALGLHLGIDTGLIELGGAEVTADGRPIGDRAARTGFLGETFVDLQLGASGVVELRAGKLRPRIGGGAIFDAYGLGLDADVDLGLVDDDNPWRFHAALLLPDATFTSAQKSSPLLDLEVALQSRAGSELRLIGAAFFDGDDGLAPVLADAVFRGRIYQAADAVERGLVAPALGSRILAFAEALSRAYDAGAVGYDVHTSGVAGWLGLEGKLDLAPLTLRSTVLAGLGRVDARATPTPGLRAYVAGLPERRGRLVAAEYLLAEGPESVRLRSLFADLTADLTLGSAWTLGAFAVLLSGDDGFSRKTSGTEDTYGSFLSLAPLLPHTAVFFNGGIASSLASPVAASIAPDGAGLLALGARAELAPSEHLRLRVLAAVMASTVASVATGGHAYGAEVDAAAAWEVTSFLDLSASAGLFAPGAYFGSLPAGFQVIVAATLSAAQLR